MERIVKQEASSVTRGKAGGKVVGSTEFEQKI